MSADNAFSILLAGILAAINALAKSVEAAIVEMDKGDDSTPEPPPEPVPEPTPEPGPTPDPDPVPPPGPTPVPGTPIPPAPAPQTHRARLEALADWPDTSAWPDIGVAAGKIPGVSITDSAVTINGQDVVIDQGFKLNGRPVDIRGGTVKTLRNLDAVQTSLTGIRMIEIWEGAVVEDMGGLVMEGDWGKSATIAIIQRIRGGGDAPAFGRIDHASDIKIRGMKMDAIKFAGGIWEDVYIGPPVGLDRASVPYDPAAVYNRSDLVALKPGFVYSPRTDGLTGIAPLGNKGTAANTPGNAKYDPNWFNHDPHGDGATLLAAINDLHIKGLYVDFREPPVGESLGTNNALRLVRNNGTTPRVGRVRIEDFLTLHGNYWSFPMQVGTGGDPASWHGPVEFIDGWIGANSLGKHYHPSGAGLISRWVNVRDAATDALIAAPPNALTV